MPQNRLVAPSGIISSDRNGIALLVVWAEMFGDPAAYAIIIVLSFLRSVHQGLHQQWQDACFDQYVHIPAINSLKMLGRMPTIYLFPFAIRFGELC